MLYNIYICSKDYEGSLSKGKKIFQNVQAKINVVAGEQKCFSKVSLEIISIRKT